MWLHYLMYKVDLNRLIIFSQLVGLDYFLNILIKLI